MNKESYMHKNNSKKTVTDNNLFQDTPTMNDGKTCWFGLASRSSCQAEIPNARGTDVQKF